MQVNRPRVSWFPFIVRTIQLRSMWFNQAKTPRSFASIPSTKGKGFAAEHSLNTSGQIFRTALRFAVPREATWWKSLTVIWNMRRMNAWLLPRLLFPSLRFKIGNRTLGSMGFGFSVLSTCITAFKSQWRFQNWELQSPPSKSFFCYDGVADFNVFLRFIYSKSWLYIKFVFSHVAKIKQEIKLTSIACTMLSIKNKDILRSRFDS